MDITEAMAHAGGMIDSVTGGAPGWVEDRVRQAMPHYIWTWTDGRSKTGVCTRCGTRMENLQKQRIEAPEEMESDKGFTGRSRITWMREHWDGTANHGKTGMCPGCGDNVTFRSLGRGRKTMEDKLFLVEYGKSEMEKDALVCVGYRVFIQWRKMDEYESIEPPIDITPMELCVFRWGKGGQRFIQNTEWFIDGRMGGGRERWGKRATGTWVRRRECVSGYTGQTVYMGCDKTPVMLDDETFEMAVEETHWKTALDGLPWTEASDYYDRITLMDRIARYPCIEYLIKLGYGELAAMAVDRKGGGLMNLRGRTARDVLRLTADEWGYIKGNKIRVTPELLEVLSINRKKGLGLGMPVCAGLAERRDAGRMTELIERYPAVNIRAACKYARRQRASLGDYLDYLRQCVQLGADMTARQVLWPTDLHEAHRRYTVQLRQMERERYERGRRQREEKQLRSAREDGELTKKLTKCWEALRGRYCFKACGLALEPFRTAEDIIMEGMKQNICIGSYVERYANGKTILCSLRRENEPEKPFHAVEFSVTSGAMVQCRGHENMTLDTDEQVIRDFWAAWDEARGTKTEVNIVIRRTKEEHVA